MIRVIVILFLAAWPLSSFAAQEKAESAESNNWQTDYPAALASAKQQSKPVLLFFTGSDWCGWCMRLQDEILTQPAFADYARQQLVLVELDFPRRKELPVVLKKQNDDLRDRFGVDGYPTLVLLAPDGHELGRLGYMEGGPKTMVRALKKLQKS